MTTDRRAWLREAAGVTLAATALTLAALAREADVGTAVVAVVVAVDVCLVATALLLRREPFVVTAADRVTHGRVALLAVISGLLSAHLTHEGLALGPLVAGLAVVSVVLDGVDGRVARARGEASEAGGRYDLAVDCALAAALAIGVAPRVGWWVLLLGALPYLFGLAGRVAPWLRGPLPPRVSRKVVGVLPSLALAAALLPLLPTTAARALVAAVLLLVLGSFARDVALLAAGVRQAQRVSTTEDGKG